MFANPIIYLFDIARQVDEVADSIPGVAIYPCHFDPRWKPLFGVFYHIDSLHLKVCWYACCVNVAPKEGHVARTQHLPLYSAAFVYVRETYRIRAKLPKILKHDLGQEAFQSALKILKSVVLANRAHEKSRHNYARTS